MNSINKLTITYLTILFVSCTPRSETESIRYYDRIATTSCTHIGFLSELGALDHVVGVTDCALIYNQEVQQAVQDGQIADMGASLTLDPERVLASGAEVVLLSSYMANDTRAEQLRRLGIHVVVIDEWREASPLDRAAWIRVFGTLTGRERQADSILAAVTAQYQQLCQREAEETNVSIMTGGDYRGTWYVPGGKSYMGRLFHDAGFSYALEADTTQGSIACTTEEVLTTFRDADVWVGAPARSLAELEQIDSKHRWFQAFQTGRVYHFQGRSTASGGNDFWETGVVHPERILQDLITIRQGAELEANRYVGKLN